MAGCVRVVNGKVQPDSLSIPDFLAKTPRGSYTSLVARPPTLVRDWPRHVLRMVKSVHAMSAAEPGMYATYLRFLAQQAPECLDECRFMDDLIRPSALAALQSAFDPSASGKSPPDHVTMSIVLVDRACELASGTSAPFEVHAAAAPVAVGRVPACRALVSGGPRKVAVAKDSEWVVARRALEKERNEWDPKAEVLLSTRDGAIIEGLVTNFFVLTRTPGSTVLTTSVPEEGAAWGAVRSRVLEVAQGLGWKVEERSPTMQERHEWAEAFISNSLRLVQPLASINCLAGNSQGHAPWTLALPGDEGGLCRVLQEAVESYLSWSDISCC